MAIITKLEAMPRKKQRLQIELDEESAGSLHRSTVREANLTAGMELTEEAWQALLMGPELRLAKEAALYCLGRHSRTRCELIHYLMDCGYHKETAEAAVEKMEDFGYVNDTQVAESMVRSGARMGKGKRDVAQRMRQRGIDTAVAEESLQSYTPDMEEEAAAALAGNYWRRYAAEEPRKRRDKTAQALMRRGFGWHVVESVLRKLGTEEND